MIKFDVCVLIINDNNEFLSVSLKNDHNDMNLPGGKVEKNESNINAAIREVKEETGLDVYNIKKLHEDIDDDNNEYFVTTYFTNKYSGNIYTEENHIVKWLPIENLKFSKRWKTYNTNVYNKYNKYKLQNPYKL